MRAGWERRGIGGRVARVLLSALHPRRRRLQESSVDIRPQIALKMAESWSLTKLLRTRQLITRQLLTKPLMTMLLLTRPLITKLLLAVLKCWPWTNKIEGVCGVFCGLRFVDGCLSSSPVRGAGCRALSRAHFDGRCATDIYLNVGMF
jgi:hypothetical protein